MLPGCKHGEPLIRATGVEPAANRAHHQPSYLRYKISARYRPLNLIEIPNLPQSMRYKISGEINPLFLLALLPISPAVRYKMTSPRAPVG